MNLFGPLSHVHIRAFDVSADAVMNDARLEYNPASIYLGASQSLQTCHTCLLLPIRTRHITRHSPVRLNLILRPTRVPQL